jgi:competence protein ComEA
MRKIISEYFSFSSRELKSLFFFLIILFIVIVLRIIMPKIQSTEIVVDPELLNELYAFSESFTQSVEPIIENKPAPDKIENKTQLTFSYFDPNIITKSELIDFGIPGRIAENVVKYRKAGGSFKNKEDILKIYGMKEVAGEEILKWIRIAEAEMEVFPEVAEIKDDSSLLLPVELNSCSFRSLIGIIPDDSRLVSRILNYKDLIGGFYSTRQLMEVYGMTEEIFDSINEYISIDTSLIRKISLTRSDYSTIIRHPYLKKNDVDLIFRYRKFAGEEANFQEIKDLKILPDSVLGLIAPYITD